MKFRFLYTSGWSPCPPILANSIFTVGEWVSIGIINQMKDLKEDVIIKSVSIKNDRKQVCIVPKVFTMFDVFLLAFS